MQRKVIFAVGENFQLRQLGKARKGGGIWDMFFTEV